MKKQHILIIFLFFTLNSCIDPYPIELIRNNKVLVVEGLLTDNSQDPDTIKIRYSSYANKSFYALPIPSLKPTITIVETKKEIALVEYGFGSFLPPKDFKILPNEHYILRFNIDGQQYESTPETYILTPPISKIYEKFNPKSILAEDGREFLVANEVFIDFVDTPRQKNNYLWRYIHYESIFYCATCIGSLYNKATESCGLPLPLGYREPYYDYGCSEERCFGIFRGKTVNVLPDLLFDGQEIIGRIIAKIPYYYASGCLVEVQQMCVSDEAYSFYKNIEVQGQSSGGLADTPPAAIVGNIKNLTNLSEKVVGYFGVANIQNKRIWVDRKDTKGRIDLLLGHEEKKEPVSINRPPLAACTKTAFRTPFKPEGWQ
jgi:Domain of unknown function (DUF4249)